MEDEIGIIADEHELKDLASRDENVLTSLSEELATAEPDSSTLCSGSYWRIMQSLFVATGVIVGFAFFIFFGFSVENYHGAVTAFLSGIVALMLFHVQVLILREKLFEWYNCKALKKIQLFSVTTSIISLVGIAVYLSLALVRHEEYELISQCHYPSVIFSFLLLSWSSYLFWVMKQHISTLENRLES